MNFPWRWLAIAVFTPAGLLYALPNLFPAAAGVQVGWSGEPESSVFVAEVEEALQNEGLSGYALRSEPQVVTVVLSDGSAQLRVRDLLKERFADRAVVALNLVDRTPEWLRALGAGAMKLGLDLRGGVHFLLAIDRKTLLTERMRARIPDIRREMRQARLRWRDIEVDEDTNLRLQLAGASQAPQVIALLSEKYPDLEVIASRRPNQLSFSYAQTAVQEMVDAALTQNLTALRNRIDALGVSEPVVRREGAERIAVELPGIQDTATARRVIGRTATLEFRLEAQADTPPGQSRTFEFREQGQGTALLLTSLVTTGEHVVSARPSFDENNQPAVSIQLDGEAGERMFLTTRNNIGRQMGVLLVESRINPISGERELERRILTLPVIKGTFGSSFQISGVGTVREASELALLLRSGALAAPMNFLTERVIGPTLGAENIALGVRSAILGLLLVALFMLVRYRFLGLVADIALVLNLTMVLALMSLLGATLTLPGIAGLVLTVGMAVDANVLIFERIREERSAGGSPRQSLIKGYDQALVTIIDANLTTLLAAVVLYAIGTGPIRGFAITLSLGILTSMFTAVTLTRALAGLGLHWNTSDGRRSALSGF